MLAEIDQRHVVGEDVKLANGGNAFLARPDAPGPYPTIILLHERYGLVQHTRDLAVRFAAEGQVALAPNLYFRAPNQEAVARGEETVQVSDEQVTQDTGACIDYLKGVQPADTRRLAVMGVCATGRHPLVVAAARPEISACVVFYGAAYRREWVPNDTLSDYIRRSKAPVLGVFGELDNLIAVEDVRRLRDVLEEAGRSYQIRLFPDAPHGWLNDTMPGRFRPRLAAEAWSMIHAFLADVFERGWPNGRVRWEFASDSAPDYDFSRNKRLE
jgi:carboxymethylenebutenolidase